MCYKPSIYNTRVYDGTDLLLYNSFTGAKVKIPDKERISLIDSILVQEKIDNEDSALLNGLLQNGFIVRHHEDERKKAQLLTMEHIYG